MTFLDLQARIAAFRFRFVAKQLDQKSLRMLFAPKNTD